MHSREKQNYIILCSLRRLFPAFENLINASVPVGTYYFFYNGTNCQAKYDRFCASAVIGVRFNAYSNWSTDTVSALPCFFGHHADYRDVKMIFISGVEE